jgi:CDP-glucose 4,6-dehydratase
VKAQVDAAFWQGKRVFLTGHTGFKGSWLSLWLAHMGAVVKGYSLSPPTTPALFDVAKVDQVIVSEIGDIRDLDRLTKSMTEFNPDIVVHMAAQALVRLSYSEPLIPPM